MKVVRIKCIDMAYNNSSWEIGHLADFGLVRIDIVGYLVEDRADCVIISKEYWGEDNQIRHLTAIPKVCILEQEEFTPTHKGEE